jgi:predicted dehydrogenase
MKIGLIGAGLIGQERIRALKKIQKNINHLNFVGFFDESKEVSLKISIEHSLTSYNSINELLAQDLDWVFIAVPHNQVKQIAINSIESGANIFVEKPLGISLAETNFIISKSKEFNRLVNVGMNYRFFKGVACLIDDVKKEKFGKLISVKFVLGHGNSPGMENSWKLQKDKCGGGCLIDPGIHVFDLINCISFGKIKINSVSDWKGFWNTGVEEEAHVLAKDENGSIFVIDLSLSRWRSEFSISINGTKGYGRLFGRGRSYGDQRYITGQRWGWLNKPSQEKSEKIVIKDYDCKDSFFWEIVSVLKYNNLISQPFSTNYIQPANEEDALKSMKILHDCQELLSL